MSRDRYQMVFPFAIVGWIGKIGLDAKQLRAWKEKIGKRARDLEQASLPPEKRNPVPVGKHKNGTKRKNEDFKE